ncbi:MAG: acyltransferase [Synechococcales cyanobacterium K44_A2020_017]|jgi:acetyltransferase-like isoleucine patch superfamily enzyme|nr:acyltransferase [Synechococcales cyanobacterium K32_A2020_035]MBF2095187.1 acyltransferase [Synechococcales cyanobacterium K44_A2020_017]
MDLTKLKDLNSLAGLIQKYGHEYLLTGLFSHLPTPIGAIIRNGVYRNLFPKLGDSVYIRPDVQFIGTRYIKIGDRVQIEKGAFIKSNSNPICFEQGVHIERGVNITAFGNYYHSDGITIGESTLVGPYVCMAGPGFIKIGTKCLLASHVSIYANNHVFEDLEQPIVDQPLDYKGIVIEDNCWLGTGVRVVDGVTIGHGSVIGAGAVVTRDIPPYSVAVGVPAKVIKTRQ